MKHFQVSGYRPHAQHQVIKCAEDVREKLAGALRVVDQLDFMALDSLDGAQPAATEEQVLSILRVRRSRSKFFDAELFADPAWDILLELYAAHLGQRRVSVTDVCIGAGVPATTALRWIKTLEQKHLIARRADPMDGRRIFLCLTPRAAGLMASFFEDGGSGAAQSA